MHFSQPRGNDGTERQAYFEDEAVRTAGEMFNLPQNLDELDRHRR
jgi:hypothetical protein